VVKAQRAGSSRRFYIGLAVVAVAGVVLLSLTMSKAKPAPAVTRVNVMPAKAEGYLLGDSTAPVQIMEFADFECPACGNFAVITEPDVRKRLIDTKEASLRFFDFPLPMHKNTMAASNAAACAADQGKFWAMHDSLFYNQPEWNGEATSNPGKVFARFARGLGLNMDEWQKCFDEQKHQDRILGNQQEGERRKVMQTPTFIIGDRMIPGSLSFDQFKAYVDSARAESAAKKGVSK
jgi:protein-disulfide isomerase